MQENMIITFKFLNLIDKVKGEQFFKVSKERARRVYTKNVRKDEKYNNSRVIDEWNK